MKHSVAVGRYARIESPGNAEDGYIHLVEDILGEWARLGGKKFHLTQLTPCCHPLNTKVGDLVQAASKSLSKHFNLDAEVLSVPSKQTENMHVKILSTGASINHSMYCFVPKSALHPEPEPKEEEAVPLSLNLFFSNG